MSIELLTRMLDRLSSRGLEFFDNSTRPPIELNQKKFNAPYYRPEAHAKNIEMIMLVQGEMALWVNGIWRQLDEDRPIVFLRHTEHTEHWLSNDRPYLLFWLTSMPSALLMHQTSYSPAAGYGQSAMRMSITSPFVGKLWECGRNMPIDRPRFHYLLMQGIDYSLKANHFSTNDYHGDVINQIKKYIDEYYHEKMALSELASMAHYSSAHLNSLFTAKIGMPVYQYLNKVRIDAAKKLLSGGNKLIKDVAAEVGFEDQLYFSRYFKKLTGQTPREFIERASAESHGCSASAGPRDPAVQHTGS